MFRYVFRCTLIVAGLCAPGIALGDGVYIPERAYPEPPEMPLQRALIVYRDGAEKLIVESALDAEGQAFGWLLPVPSAPTEFEAGSPGLLSTLAYATHARITHDRKGDLLLVCLGASFVCGLTALLFLPRSTFVDCLFLFFTYALLAALFVPALGSGSAAGAASTPRVSVLESSRVGNYDVAVLDAEDADGLDVWLESSGFASLMPEGRRIVDDYIRQRWVFVAARLRREGSGLSVPHPLSVTFACDEPVYPMRLTALSGGSLALDLWVLGDAEARVVGMRREFSDIFSGPVTRTVYAYDRSLTERPCFEGATFAPYVGHPGLVGLLWDGCVLTSLSAMMEPADMAEDLNVTFVEPAPYQRHYYSSAGALQTTLLWGLPPWAMALFVTVLIRRERILKKGGRAFALRRLLAPITVAAVLVGTIMYLALPKVPVTPLGKGWHHALPDPEQMLLRAAYESGQEPPTVLGLSAAEVAKRLEAFFHDAATTNQFTGEPVRMEDSPGNFVVLEDDRGVVIRGFDRSGFPLDWVLAEPAEQ